MTVPTDPIETPRWQRRPTERHREILDAAVLVFGECGFDCATVSAIAERAGVSSGTVAHYFGSKRGLFEAAMTDRFLEGVAGGEALLAAHQGSARDLMRLLLSRMWQRLMRPGTADLMLFGLAQAQTFPDTAAMMCREIGERWRRLLGAVLVAGIESGEFRTVDIELQARVIASGLAGMVISVQHFSRFESRAPDPVALLEQYLESVDRALAVTK
jgi:AcrR family transcriptional regulator